MVGTTAGEVKPVRNQLEVVDGYPSAQELFLGTDILEVVGKEDKTKGIRVGRGSCWNPKQML